MDAGESGTRQSGYTSASRPDIFRQHSREPPGKSNRDASSMAAAALMSPAPAAYQPHNPSYTPSYSLPSAPTSMQGILSQPEPSRRTPKEADPSQRQSLPSISEMFNHAKANPYSPTTPTTMTGSSSLAPPPPPSFVTSGPSRPEAGPDSRPPPTQFGSRPEPSGPLGSVYQFGDQRELSKPPESVQRHSSISSSHGPPTGSYASGQLPPGQLPLSQPPPISPRHLGPSGPSYESQRPPLHSDEEYGIPRRYDSSTLNRHFEAWGYSESLHKIAWTSRTIANFAEAYHGIASEQHAGQPVPQRLPTEREVSDMLSNVDYLRKTLENVRDVVQHSIASEKARDGGKHKGSYDDDDTSVYGDGMKPPYNLGEVKKRRGRAAPPGRCHSCNRIDTPEWRRGPDGARTLCNACGLHYAKLERKRQMEQRSSRMKNLE